MVQRFSLVVVLHVSLIVSVCSFVVTKSRTLRIAERNSHLFATSVVSPTISSKARQFFLDVQDGLRSREKPELDDIGRVLKFCEYAGGTTSPIIPPIAHHVPCEQFIDDLTARGWWDSSSFLWIAALESHSQAIIQELQTVLAAEQIKEKDWSNRRHNSMGEGWTAFRLQKMGEWNDENMLSFPVTTKAVKDGQIPLAMRGVMFAKQAPGTGVAPHSDEWNFLLTAHLGVVVPKGGGCCITVAGETRSWQQDKAIIFDTSFTHSTRNDSDEDRYVLIIDFWHPELTLPEQRALEFVFNARNQYDAAQSRLPI